MNQNLSKSKNTFRFKYFAKKAYAAFNSINKIISIGVLASTTIFFVDTKRAIGATADHRVLHEISSLDEYTNVNNCDTIVNQNLEEVTVTSTRSITSLRQTATQIQIIDRERIKELPAQSVQDLLNYIAGVDVQQRGGHGVQADISIRGGSFDQTAILLNGINLSNPQTGHYSFDIPINISDIKQIEIIYGPSSITYGASAFSGGINIITYTEREHNFYGKVDFGGHNLKNIEANTAISIRDLIHTQVSVGHSKSDGYIKNSDYSISNVLLQTTIQKNTSKVNLQVGFNNKHYGANTFYTAAYPNQYDKTNSQFISAKGEFGNKLKFKPSIYWNRHNDCFELYRDGSPDIPSWYTDHNYHRTDVYGSNINFQYKTKYGITNFATEIRSENIKSNILGKEMSKPRGKYIKSDDRTNISYIAEHVLLFQKTTISAGILLNYNSSLEQHYKFYPNIGISHCLSDDFKVFSSWSKAFRMPTFTDLYYTTKTHIGNSNLKEENSQSLELGFQHTNSFVQNSLTTYWMKGDHLIDWVKQNPEDKWESQNLTQLDKIGFDINSTFYINKLVTNLNSTTLQINYTIMHQSKNSGDFISNYILNYLKDKININLRYTIIKDLIFSYNFRWQNRKGNYIKYENLKPAKETEFTPFSISDIKFNYNFNDINLHLDLNNIFDKRYYDIGNIPQAGFWLIAGISYHF